MGSIDIIKLLSTVLSSADNNYQQNQDENNRECPESNPESNPVLVGEKQVCYAASPSAIEFTLKELVTQLQAHLLTV